MNRIINLKKPDIPAPRRAPSLAPVQPLPSPRPASLPAAKPSPRPEAAPRPAPQQAATEELRWRFSLAGEPRVVRNAVIGLVIVAGFLAFFQYYALAAILVLSGITLALHNNPGAAHEVMLSEAGIRIHRKTYFYRDIKSFWIAYVPGGIQELSIQLRGWYAPYLTVPLEGKNPARIREFLIRFIPEKEHSQSLVSLLLRRIGL